MALADKLTAAEYAALPQALKDAGAYKAGPKAEDGGETWVLDSPEAAGLAAKLKAKDETIQRLQNDSEETKRRFSELEKRFEGIDVDHAREAMKLREEQERGEYIAKKDFAGLLEAEQKKWEAAHAKKIEALETEKAELEEDLHDIIVRDTFRSLVTSGQFEDGQEKRKIPKVMGEYEDVAWDHYSNRYRPKVNVETKSGSRARRAVSTVDELEKDMRRHIADEWLPSVQKLFCQQPQHEGGHDKTTRPAREGSPGSPQEIPRDQADTRISDLASGKAFVDLAG